MRVRAAILMAAGMAGAATAGEPARVRPPEHPRAIPSDARLGVASIAAASSAIRLDDPHGRLRTGFGGSLVDLFPVEGSRFHLSAGGRLFGRAARNKALDERGLLAPPRGGNGWRAGRRFAPALLMGVSEPAGGGVSFGLDAGVVMGPAMDRGARMPRGLRRGGGDGPRGANGVARVTMGYRF